MRSLYLHVLFVIAFFSLLNALYSFIKLFKMYLSHGEVCKQKNINSAYGILAAEIYIKLDCNVRTSILPAMFNLRFSHVLAH